MSEQTSHSVDTGAQCNGFSPEPMELDALVIGGGFSGCRLLYELRKVGFSTKILESGSDLGGVWHWNCYPGARVDSEYRIYALDIPEVWNTWTWTERFPGYAEIQRYFAHVDKTLGLRKDCIFDSKVVRATYDSERNKWEVECANGRLFRTQFLISSMGFAAKRHIPDWPGLETFNGIIQHSSFWDPKLDLSGKRVAIIGQGATGLQIFQETAKIASDVRVFIRTPIIAIPMRQRKMSIDEQKAERENYAKWFQKRYTTGSGFLDPPATLPHTAHNSDEMEAHLKKLWNTGGFCLSISSYTDMMFESKSNRALYDFWARNQRSRIHDPRLKDILCPLEPIHPFGAKRPSLEQDYYDLFNQPNVHVIDLKTVSIEKILPNGIQTSDGAVHEVDVIALATGFDAVTGGLLDIEITGLNGKTLREKWSEGIYTWLGIATSGFPNFFFTYVPQAPTALSSGPSTTETQCMWLRELLTHMRITGKTKIDAMPEREAEWRKLVHIQENMTLRSGYGSSYNGANIPGKRREPLNWGGGVGEYNQRLRKVADAGYDGFVLQD